MNHDLFYQQFILFMLHYQTYVIIYYTLNHHQSENNLDSRVTIYLTLNGVKLIEKEINIINL